VSGRVFYDRRRIGRVGRAERAVGFEDRTARRSVLDVRTIKGGLRAEQIVALQQTAGNRAVQRLLTSIREKQRPERGVVVQRKLNWQGTRWDDAGYLDASRGGSGGVLFVGEAGREVVVKPGEAMASEAALAALLHNEAGERMAAGERTGGQKLFGVRPPPLLLAPGLRIAPSAERRELKAALEPLLPQVGSKVSSDPSVQEEQAFKKGRAKTLVDMLDSPGVVVQDVARGSEMREAIKVRQQHTEMASSGKRRLAKDSPLRIFKEKRTIKALGAAAAVDLFMGNKDRLIGMYNAENFMVTPYSLTMIDNIWMGSDMSYFQTTKVTGRDGKTTGTITADQGLATWKSDPHVKMLADGKYEDIAKRVWKDMLTNASFKPAYDPNASKADKKARSAAIADEEKAFKEAMKGYEPRFIKTFSAGLKKGKKQVLKSLKGLEADPTRLQALVPEVDLTQLKDTMRQRRAFLQGKQ
jgi:hypothetical protein